VYYVNQTESVQLESKERCMGRGQTKRDQESVHNHCTGVEERWLKSYCCVYIYLIYLIICSVEVAHKVQHAKHIKCVERST